MRAALYLRISLDQTGQALGVTRQQEDCRELAATLGWDIAEVYVDNDISATSGKDRPGYRKMLADIAAGHIEAVIAWAPDRLYRRLKDLEDLIPVLEEHGTAVRTVKAGDLDLSSAYGRMIARILGAVATGEGEIKSERWRRSWRQGREMGAVARTGSRLYGYTRDGEVIPDEAAIARGMAADLISGVPLLEISRRLERDGILTTRGSLWRTGTLRQYLNNPRLAGHSTLGRNVPTGKVNAKTGRPIQRRVFDVVAEGKWEPILDRDTSDTIRALFVSRARGVKPRVSVLNGLLFCGKCDTRMITSGTRGQRTYRCPNRPGMGGCGGVSGYAEPIEEIVESYARTRLADDKVRAHLHRLASIGAPEALTEIHNLEDRLTELEAQLDEPGIPVATILRAIDRTKDRLEDCQRQLSAATPVTPLPRSGGEWPADLERRRRLIELVVARVTLSPATRHIKAFDVERVEIEGR